MLAAYSMDCGTECQIVAALHGGTGNVVTAANPAAPGEIVSLYVIGMEAVVLNPPAMGFPALAEPLSLSQNLPDIYIAGKSARILFSGLAPGLVGVTQINLAIPNDAPTGLAGLRMDYDRHPDDKSPCPECGVVPIR